MIFTIDLHHTGFAFPTLKPKNEDYYKFVNMGVMEFQNRFVLIEKKLFKNL
jgi:hypothetical protein